MKVERKYMGASLVQKRTAIYVTFYILILLFGIFFSNFLFNLSIKNLAFIPISLAALVFLSKDWERSIKLFFCYLSIEGLLKMITNYHPVVHIGADILLLLICLNWFFATVIIGFREAKFRKAPLTMPIIFFVLWILIEIVNPYAISLYASVASFKVHITMIPFYFFAYFFIDSKEQIIKYWNLFLGICFMVCTFAIVEYILGPKSLTWISSTYVQKAERFHGFLYRPFSTTALAGGGSIFAHIAAPFAISSLFFKNSVFKRILIVLLLFFATMTLFISQVRQLFLASLIVLIISFILMRSYLSKAVFNIIIISVIGLFAFQVTLDYAMKRTLIMERFATLLNVKTYKTARAGGMEKMLDVAFNYPLGAGMSRTGSAASKFKKDIEKDRTISPLFGMVDNYFAAMMIETGIPGTALITFIFLYFIIKGFQIQKSMKDKELKVIAITLFAFMGSLFFMSFGSQPITANPYQSLFWFLGGLLLKLPKIEKMNEQK